MRVHSHKSVRYAITLLAILGICMCIGTYLKQQRSLAESVQAKPDYSQSPESGMEERYRLSNRYIYGTLNEEERMAYRYILYCIDNFESEIQIPVSEKCIDKAWKDVRRDFGEIYWVNGYQYCCKEGYILFQPEYTYSEEEAAAYNGIIRDKTEEILRGIPSGATDYERVKCVYEYLSNNVTYSFDVDDSQSPVELFTDGKAMCWGYAATAQFIFQEMGIKSAIVTGITDENENHAWNIVKIDGSWYHFDATFAGTREDKSQGIEYKYMAMNDTIAETEHFADDTYALPECNSLESNYYAKEGLLFTGTDRQALIDMLQEKYSVESDDLVVMYEDEAISRLIDEEFFEDLARTIGEREFVEQTDLNYQRMVFIFENDKEGEQ